MKVVVIGGGLAGVSAIVGLRKADKDVEIVLIEPKDHCEVYWAAYRSPFEPWVAEGSLLMLEKWAEENTVHHIRTTVTKLTKSSAILANGDSVDYDVAVVATGADTRAPFLGRGLPENDGTKQTRLEEMKNYGEKFMSAKSVLVCGGGLIGTELAGDICAYAKKAKKSIEVTLVHSGPHLSHIELTKEASSMLLKKLEKLGVKVILNEKAIEKDGKMQLQSSGETIEADEVIFTTGLVPVNGFLKDGDFADSLDEKGWVEADEYFRVKNSDGKVFAIGDCSTFLPNSGYQNLDNAKTIGQNIKATIDFMSKNNGAAPNENESMLKKGAASYQVTLSTVGPSDGVFYTPAFYTQWIFPFIKNQTMFLFRPKMELGLKTT